MNTRSITFAINLGTCREHAQRLVSGIKDLLAASLPIQGVEEMVENSNRLPFVDSKMCLSPREAFFARKKKVSVKDSLGEICEELIFPYPPRIPVMILGEIVTQRALDYLLHVKMKGVVISGASDSLLSSMIVC